KVASMRSITCDTRVTESVSWLANNAASETVIVPVQGTFHADTRTTPPPTNRWIEVKLPHPKPVGPYPSSAATTMRQRAVVVVSIRTENILRTTISDRSPLHERPLPPL